MNKIKKVLISALALTLCSHSYCYANDAINIMNAVMHTLSTNPPKTTPKPIYPQAGTTSTGSSTSSTSTSSGSTTSTTSSTPTVQSPAQTASATPGTVISRYKEMTSAVWEAYEPQMSTLDITALLSSQHDGVVSTFDTPMDEIKGRTVLPWYNDNYIVWNTGMGYEGIFYSQEFNKSKNETAFVVIVKPDSYDKYFRVYEYERNGQHSLPLTTALIYDPSADEAYLFDGNRNLLASKNGQTIKNVKPEVVKNPDFIEQITAIFYKKQK